MTKNLEFANCDGDEVLWEAADQYADAMSINFEFTTERQREENNDSVRAIFIDGARWAIKNRLSLDP